ncbi:regulator of G-protein signaling 18 isoform X2 [Paramormyrops kingsleyae]|uniref:regulator of G-protein signaling 18 isoform X2 n=1 Tax=Paramormyrops kingsleyae TaxID=1676925 RepID=UPI000CD6110E|nr:regulator of G-protein signaling 18-like isoform X2 [Paramormyrops kingsleyae]
MKDDKDKKSRISRLLTKSGSHENVSPEKMATTKNSDVSPEAALQWGESFEELLRHSDGVEMFSKFLKSEFSEENIQFWLACNDYKSTRSDSKRLNKAKTIYALYIEADAPKEINIDHPTKVTIQQNIRLPTVSCFDVAQSKVFSLMKKDSYPRFLQSNMYLRIIKRKNPGSTMYRRRSRSCVFSDHAEATSNADVWL